MWRLTQEEFTSALLKKSHSLIEVSLMTSTDNSVTEAHQSLGEQFSEDVAEVVDEYLERGMLSRTMEIEFEQVLEEVSG